MIVQSDNKNRGKWLLAIFTEPYPGKDGIIRAVRLKTENGTFERPVQHLLPMELNGDTFLENLQNLQLLSLDQEEIQLQQHDCAWDILRTWIIND